MKSIEIKSPHVVMISKPGRVADLIMKAASKSS
jgi:hypothetical protein